MNSKCEFPITSNVVPAGSDRVVLKTLNRNDLVHCWWCREEFIADSTTAMTVDQYDNVALKCPFCGKLVSVLYYYDEARPSTKKERSKIAKKILKSKEKKACENFA